jgi:dTDP-4-dehydrorhamnose reductase
MLGQDLGVHLRLRHSVVPLSRAEADITDSNQVTRAFEGARPDAVIHTAAFTAVDDCESHSELAFRVNAEGTRNVALACSQLRIPLLYLSTDYVFDGEKPEPYLETDQPNPLSVYGSSKLQGERNVLEVAERFWIVRISWLFGPLGKNFVKAILKQAEGGRPLRVVDDQVGGPTYTMDLAAKLEEIVTRAAYGIYHVTNQGYCSWFEFAQEILRQAGLDQVPVSPIATSALDRPARRPKNSRLATIRRGLSGTGALPSWQDALRRYLSHEAQGRGPGAASQVPSP